jgi:DNA-binding GntR family transcriptional regulator
MPRSSAQLVDRVLAAPAEGAPATPTARSLTARVADRLREAIMDGRFPLGGALSELKLAAALQVSRTPVRDALTALQIEGLIDVRPQAGSFVFQPSDEEVDELAEFRRVIEGTALRFAFARRRDEALQQMRASADAMERAAASGDTIGVARGDTAFHQAIVENSANQFMIATYRLVSGRVGALRSYNNQMHSNANQARVFAEHRSVIAAFAKGDLDTAEAILAEHIWKMRLVYRAARQRAPRPPAADAGRSAAGRLPATTRAARPRRPGAASRPARHGR